METDSNENYGNLVLGDELKEEIAKLSSGKEKFFDIDLFVDSVTEENTNKFAITEEPSPNGGPPSRQFTFDGKKMYLIISGVWRLSLPNNNKKSTVFMAINKYLTATQIQAIKDFNDIKENKVMEYVEKTELKCDNYWPLMEFQKKTSKGIGKNKVFSYENIEDPLLGTEVRCFPKTSKRHYFNTIIYDLEKQQLDEVDEEKFENEIKKTFENFTNLHEFIGPAFVGFNIIDISSVLYNQEHSCITCKGSSYILIVLKRKGKSSKMAKFNDFVGKIFEKFGVKNSCKEENDEKDEITEIY